jgi:LysR family glycine cleavage system transcriptional activator
MVWVMGPTALISDDVAAGRLVIPFPEVSLPARTYFAYLPDRDLINPASMVFCEWLAKLAERTAEGLSLNLLRRYVSC